MAYENNFRQLMNVNAEDIRVETAYLYYYNTLSYIVINIDICKNNNTDFENNKLYNDCS